MAVIAPPTLEDLRKAAQGAWLWDGARGRIVWANAAGIAAFDGQSLFDLIDLPFDSKEPSVARIAELTQALSHGESQQALLHFPSVGHAVPLDCTCSLHALADGRSGLLVVAKPLRRAQHHADGVFTAAFAQLPLAACFIAKSGAVTDANAAALAFGAFADLSALIGNNKRAITLLERLTSSALISSVEHIESPLGKREVRLTLRRLDGADEPFALLLLDDITERRMMERQMVEGEIAQPAPTSDAETFEDLGRTLKAALDMPVIAKLSPKIETVVVPKTIRVALEQTGHALAIAQNGKPAFVSKKAVELLGYDGADNVLAAAEIWQALRAVKTACMKLEINDAHGKPISVSVDASTIPWIDGPAQQYILTLVKPEIIKPVEIVKAPEVQVLRPELVPVAESELNNILDIASDGIITLDRHGKILSFSAGAEAIFGYRIAEVLDKPLVDLMAADSRNALLDYLSGFDGPGLSAVFNDGREMTAIVKQGGTVPLFLTIGRLQSPTSSAAFGAVVRDITSWKRTEKELREAKDAAEEASRQKSDFLARISHELRTPLNAIIGFSEVMRLGQFGEIKNEKYRGYVNDIHASGGHLLSLINDLLDLSKIESGKMELNFTAVNIADATEHAMRLLQDAATRGRVLVRKSFPDKMPRVVADLRSLRQVMLNILSNAIKFTDPGGQVIVSTVLNKSGELALRIKDTGIGMNADQLHDALEPFKRVETIGRETQGTGLGLPLTKALVEANRAKFDLSSEPGQGTLIEITFPTTRVLAE